MPANPPSAAPLDLDALERLATETRDAWIAFSTAPNTHSGNDARVDYLHIREAFKNALSPDVILALVAAARRGGADTERLTHVELCDGLGLPRWKPRPDWLPYAVEMTRVEILAGERRIVYGGGMRCGTCGYGVDIRPGTGTIGPNGPTTAADRLACPKCGAAVAPEAER